MGLGRAFVSRGFVYMWAALNLHSVRRFGYYIYMFCYPGSSSFITTHDKTTRSVCIQRSIPLVQFDFPPTYDIYIYSGVHLYRSNETKSDRTTLLLLECNAITLIHDYFTYTIHLTQNVIIFFRLVFGNVIIQSRLWKRHRRHAKAG